MGDIFKFRHDWKLPGLATLCNTFNSDKISTHPHISSLFVIDYPQNSHYKCKAVALLYPNGLDTEHKDHISVVLKMFDSVLDLNFSCTVSLRNESGHAIYKYVETRNLVDNCYKILKFIQRDRLPSVVKSHSEVILTFEGWVQFNIIDKEMLIMKHLKDHTPTTDHFDVRLLLSTKSFAFKWTIEDISLFIDSDNSIELPQFKFKNQFKLFPFFKHTATDSIEFKTKLIFKENATLTYKYEILDVNMNSWNSFKNDAICHPDIECSLNYLIDKSEIQDQSNLLAPNDKLVIDFEFVIFDNSVNVTNLNESTITNLRNYIRMTNGKVKRSWKIDIKKCLEEAAKQEKLQKEEELEKADEIVEIISLQKTSLDQSITHVTNIYNHYFENSTLHNVLANTDSKSEVNGNVTFQSEQNNTNSSTLLVIEKLESIVNQEIKPILAQNERMCQEMKKLRSYNKVLVEAILHHHKLIQENVFEVREIHDELNQLKQSKNESFEKPKPRMKQIVFGIIAVINILKNDLAKSGDEISSLVKQVRRSEFGITKEKIIDKRKEPNPIVDHIQSHTSSLINYVQSVPTSQTVSNKIKENHIQKLDEVKRFLITNLQTDDNFSKQNGHH